MSSANSRANFRTDSLSVAKKIDRPDVLGGITVRVRTGCGSMYVQLNWYHGRIVEVFATLGHSGGCATCEMEALTRAVTVGLKCGAPLDHYIKQFLGIHCPNPMPFPKENAVYSCPDGIAKVLKEYGSLDVGSVIKLITDINGSSAPSGDAVSDSPSSDDPHELSETDVQERVAVLAEAREEQGCYDDIIDNATST